MEKRVMESIYYMSCIILITWIPMENIIFLLGVLTEATICYLIMGEKKRKRRKGDLLSPYLLIFINLQ